MASAAQRLTEEELRIFSAKIRQHLAERPLDLDPVSHRERVAALLRQVGEASFYQLLGIVPTSTAQEIHEAYDRIARLVHPTNAPGLGLSGREGVLELLFERITLAYLTLSQPDRRKAYDRDLAPDVWAAAWAPAPGRRREEVLDIAQGYYERATALTAAEDFHFAVELLQQAVRIDSRPEYHALLGKLLAKNPRWLPAAAEHLRQAVSLGARDPELPAALEEILRRLETGETAEPEASGPPRTTRGRKRATPEVEVLDVYAEEFDVPLPERSKRWR